jgi:transposase
MTYNFNIIITSIKLYLSLEKQNIIGCQRLEIIKSTYDFNMSTFYNWLFLYKNLSVVDFKNHFINHKRTSIITSEMIKFIIDTVKKNTFIRINGIKNKIKNELKINISKTSINTILKKNNITFKKVYKQINPYSNEKLKELKTNLKNRIKRNGIDNIISTDEMSIHYNEYPSKSWSNKGEQFILNSTNKSIKSKNISLCMSVDTSNNINYIIKEGSINGEDFNNFISNINKKHPNKKFMMDNARTHHTKLFKKSIKSKNLKIIYNIPYHSKYNPIEYVFSLLRRDIENNLCKDLDDIILTIDKFINNIKKTNKIYKMYKNIFKQLKC